MSNRPTKTPDEHMMYINNMLNFINLFNDRHHKARNAKRLFDYILDNDILNLPNVKNGKIPNTFRSKLDEFEKVDMPELGQYNPTEWVPTMKLKLYSKSY